jgi:hypothetical protein
MPQGFHGQKMGRPAHTLLVQEYDTGQPFAFQSAEKPLSSQKLADVSVQPVRKESAFHAAGARINDIQDLLRGAAKGDGVVIRIHNC